MNYQHVVIEAVATVDAPHLIASADLEAQIEPLMSKIGIPQGQIERLTGIQMRRFWDRGVLPSDVATLAATKVLEQSQVDVQTLGALINTSVSKDYLEPSVASLVHGNLGLPATCQNFDLGNACLGFVNGMDFLSMMIETRQIQKGILVNGESSREITENTLRRLQDPQCDERTFRENFASLTLGSGAVAMILSHVDATDSRHFVNGSVSLAATEHSRLCFGDNQRMVTDASSLLIAGVALATSTWKLAEASLENWRGDAIDLFVPHQVSVRHTQALCETLGLDFEKFHLNVQSYGNMGPAALPITLAMAADAGRCRRGDRLGLMGIGSGLNCTMMSVTW